ncbi:hypothetical protein GM921_00630 [Pedobacter sp. LMG 31464]|uniref:Uncharacterized protein n=1 Tax=Pedobacter planticolens TaxID=2679964 RepID=A0A923DWI9_9SPHI|nr:hypothetical protein [Pedobacter planticolens]MBB2143975.1 hypothetical protein [Pedobacter planticolens]
MKLDFGFTIYFLDPPPLSEIETFFVQVHGKLGIHQRHFQTTINLYQKEVDAELQKQKDELGSTMATANAEYKKAYDELKADEYEKHIYAIRESGIDEIEHHFATLDEQTKLEYIEMADHYNKSSAATLYALLESELRRFCGQAMKHFKLTFPVERFEKSDYLYSMMEYLKLVAIIDTSKADTFLPKLQQLQFLRNKIMHNGAEFDNEANEKLDNLVDQNKGVLFFDELPEENIRILRVKSNFVIPYYEIINDFFISLFSALNQKLNFSFLADRVKFIFGFLSKAVTVSLENEKEVKNGKQYVFDVKSDHKDNEFEFKLKLTIATSATDGVSITNQLDPIKDMERWVQQITQNNAILRQAFVGFLNPKSKHQIDLMLYPPS